MIRPESDTVLAAPQESAEAFVQDLLDRMTVAEKVGQLNLVNGQGGHIGHDLADHVRSGRVGAVLNEVDPDTVNELQRLAVEESRLGIPLLIGRDVIHGFRTVFPIPLAQACSWDPETIRQGARVAALEAAARGVNWTFAPMVDIGRDPRWGRVAECLGEDPHLASVLAAAMVEGFQGEALDEAGSIAACAKHFAGYGASESGKDYASTNIPERELRSVHLPPFRAAAEAGAATFMASFSDLDGIPASANRFLMTGVLREEWDFRGFVVSDWDSIPQLTVHGMTPGPREAAREAALAGVDMDMAGWTYHSHLESLVESGEVPMDRLDAMVAAVLRVKLRLGLFEHPWTDPGAFPASGNPDHRAAAREAAVRSAVLLKNEGSVLPLDPRRLKRLAVIGPMADEATEQLGTWIFDGDPSLSTTPLQAIRDRAEGRFEVTYARGLWTTRDRGHGGLHEAAESAAAADAAVLFLGEEAILSGEAHCRADIALPGAQADLIRAVSATGTPLVVVLMTGRPLALESVIADVDALLCAWHPGTEAGPAIADILFGVRSPSGKLAVTFPRVTGQIPIYYAQRNTGKPVSPESWTHMDHLPRGAPQLSAGMTSFHMDTHFTPLFPFGHGLGYTRFEYSGLTLDRHEVPVDGAVSVFVQVTNAGARPGTEVVQLYVRDPVASVTRPVRELKDFRRIELEPGETRTVRFVLRASQLAFPGRDMRDVVEPGRIQLWVGGSSQATLGTEFEIVDNRPS